jgi:hypothetical protein
MNDTKYPEDDFSSPTYLIATFWDILSAGGEVAILLSRSSSTCTSTLRTVWPNHRGTSAWQHPTQHSFSPLSDSDSSPRRDQQNPSKPLRPATTRQVSQPPPFSVCPLPRLSRHAQLSLPPYLPKQTRQATPPAGRLGPGQAGNVAAVTFLCALGMHDVLVRCLSGGKGCARPVLSCPILSCGFTSPGQDGMAL